MPTGAETENDILLLDNTLEPVNYQTVSVLTSRGCLLSLILSLVSEHCNHAVTDIRESVHMV